MPLSTKNKGKRVGLDYLNHYDLKYYRESLRLKASLRESQAAANKCMGIGTDRFDHHIDPLNDDMVEI